MPLIGLLKKIMPRKLPTTTSTPKPLASTLAKDILDETEDEQLLQEAAKGTRPQQVGHMFSFAHCERGTRIQVKVKEDDWESPINLLGFNGVLYFTLDRNGRLLVEEGDYCGRRINPTYLWTHPSKVVRKAEVEFWKVKGKIRKGHYLHIELGKNSGWDGDRHVGVGRVTQIYLDGKALWP